MSKAEQAVECFRNGYNCSQAVFSTYSEQLGLDRESALKVSCGLGGGMGRLGETCGAVSGAYLLIGLKHGKVQREDNPARDTTYRLVREFTQKFKERNQTTQCRELLGMGFEDKDSASRQTKKICPKMIQDAAEIVEEMLALSDPPEA